MINPDPMLGPKLKVDRAKRHLADFEAALQAFFAEKPYELVSNPDMQTGEVVYRIKVHKCLPDELSIIVGDVVHNLRSALDQMVCALVRANGQQVTGGNAFPILGSAKSFEERSSVKLKNVSFKAARFIRRLKPYQGGNAPLWMLSELDNMDKHNAIVPIAAGQVQASTQIGMSMFHIMPDGGFALGFPPAETGAQPFGFQQGFFIPEGAKPVPLLKDNCEVYRSPFGAYPSVAENVQAAINITFGKTKVTNNEVITTTLQQLVELVEGIINIVERRVL